MAAIPRALASKVSIIIFIVLFVYLVGFGVVGLWVPALEPSATVQLILGNYTNVASATGASIAAGAGAVVGAGAAAGALQAATSVLTPVRTSVTRRKARRLCLTGGAVSKA